MQMPHNSVDARRKQQKPVYFKQIDLIATVDSDSRKISGYAAVFGNIDDARDMLIKGCFAKSIAERGPNSNTNRKIILLWMHDMDEPLGRITMLQEDSKGLYFEAVVDEIELGDRALTQLKSGTINQFSIGYCYVWDKMEYDSDLDAFICKEINLFEISPVSIGCNELTGFEGMKAEQIETEREKSNRELEKALKSIDDYPTQYNLRQIIAKQIALAETQPPQALKDRRKPQDFDLANAIEKTVFIN